MVVGAVALQTGLIAQGAGQIGLAAAAGAGDQQVLPALQPVALGQPGDLGSVDVARVLVVDLLGGGAQLEASVAHQPRLFALLARQKFLLDQESQPFDKRQAVVGRDLFLLLLQGSGHAAESELAQAVEGLLAHAVLRLVEVVGATDVVVALGELQGEARLLRQLVTVAGEYRFELLKTA
ncbi:protein of unknown function (plasmid) [Citrobacter freundii]|nr:protein of unknown function [Citrobacter freundii]